MDEGFGTNTPVDVVIRPEDVEIVAPGGRPLWTAISLPSSSRASTTRSRSLADGFEWLVDTTQLLHRSEPMSGSASIPFNIQIMNKPESEDEEAAEIDV